MYDLQYSALQPQCFNSNQTAALPGGGQLQVQLLPQHFGMSIAREATQTYSIAQQPPAQFMYQQWPGSHQWGAQQQLQQQQQHLHQQQYRQQEQWLQDQYLNQAQQGDAIAHQTGSLHLHPHDNRANVPKDHASTRVVAEILLQTATRFCGFPTFNSASAAKFGLWAGALCAWVERFHESDHQGTCGDLWSVQTNHVMSSSLLIKRPS